jgi:MFS family permease
MTSSKSEFPLFFGSTIVLACFIGMLGSTGGMLFSSLGVLIKPLSDAFGWSRGDISFGATCLTLGIVVGMLTTGHLIDKYGSRRILIISVLISIVVVMIGPQFISSLPFFYLMLILGAIIGGPTNTVAYARIISCWFDQRRGLFIGIIAAGMGMGFAVVPLLTDFAVSQGGWKAGYYALGFVMLFMVMPVLIFLIKDYPEDIGLYPDGIDVGAEKRAAVLNENNSLSLLEAAKTPTFCLLVIIVSSVAFSMMGILTQIVPMMTDRGIDSSTAARVAASTGIGMASARLIVGYLLDRVFAPRLAMVVLAFAIIGVLIIAYSNYLPLYFLAAFLVGFGVGSESDLIAYMASRYYGMRSYATIFSWLFSAYMLGTGFGPYIYGRSFDIHGDYSLMLYISIGLLVLSIVLLAFLAPYDKYIKAKRELAG